MCLRAIWSRGLEWGYDSCQLRAPVSDAGGGRIEDTPELRVALQVFRTSGPRIGHWALAVSAYRCPTRLQYAYIY